MLSLLSILKLKFGKFDWILIIGIVIFTLASLLILFSLDKLLFQKQLIWYSLFFLLIFLGSQVDWRWLISQGWFRQSFYWFCVLLVFAANFQHRTIRGSKSWLVFGDFQFQPAELVKLSLILLFAGFFAKRHLEAWVGKNISISLFYAILPMLFIVAHPDLGSAIVILGIWFGFLFMNGFKLKRAIFIIFIFILAALLSWLLLFKPYQKERILSFLNPGKDLLGANYNVNQSKIAIGSAGLWGKGFGLGTQSHLKFLPEPETDFIFAAFVEEWGIFGGLMLLLTFLLIIFRITRIGLIARSNDFRFISLGTALVLIIHFFVNIGSNLGLTPVTGVTFPFLSYGGSNLLTTAVMMSIIQYIKVKSS